MAITLDELKDGMIVAPEHEANLLILLEKVNKIRTAYGKPLLVTSGYRSMEKHLAIYKAKGITDQSKIPMKSKHLFGQAVDLVPLDGDIKGFQKWIESNKNLMDEIDVFFEKFKFTKTWVHVQSVQYGSYKYKAGKTRFFIP